MGKKKRQKKATRQIATQLPVEDRRTEAITVAWMLSTMVTLGAVGLAGCVWLALPLLADQAEGIGTIGLIPRMLLFVATVTGTVSFIMMACAIRLRRVPPPRAIIIASAAICCCPFGVHLLIAVR